MSIQLTFDKKCCTISELRGRIFKVYKLTCGVQFNQWRVLLVAQGANRTCTIAVVPEIITLILLADINLFSDCNVSTVQLTPEFKNDKVKHNNTVKATGQIGYLWSKCYTLKILAYFS